METPEAQLPTREVIGYAMTVKGLTASLGERIWTEPESDPPPQLRRTKALS
jgi:hypothetical protein